MSEKSGRRRLVLVVLAVAIILTTVAVVSVVILSRPPSSTTTVTPEQGGRVAIGDDVVVDVPPRSVDAISTLSLRSATVDRVPRGLALGPMFQLELATAHQVAPFTVTLRLPGGNEGSTVWLATAPAGDGAWRATPVGEAGPGGTVRGPLIQLTAFGVGWVDRAALTQDATLTFQAATLAGPAPSVQAPQCENSDQVERQGVKVEADGDAVRWCTGLAAGRLSVRILNARPYPVVVTYDDTATLLGRRGEGLVFPFADRLGAASGLDRGAAGIIVSAGTEIEFGIDRIWQGTTRFTIGTQPLALLAGALDVAVRMYAAVALVASRIGVAGQPDPKSSVDDVAAGIDLDGPCRTALAGAGAATDEVARAFPDHLSALNGCLRPTVGALAVPVEPFAAVVTSMMDIPAGIITAGQSTVVEAAEKQTAGDQARLVVAYPRLAAGAATAAQFSAGSPRHILVMDVSGSMAEEDGRGTVKIDGAKAAVQTTLEAMPSSALVGLRTYPSAANGCGSRMESGLTSPTDEALRARVRGLQPNGGTPTGPALLDAVADLEQAGLTPNSTIILVSDGESNCGPNPCDVARDIAIRGVAIVNAVGFNVSGRGRDELACVAQATGGRYVDVTEADGLRQAISSAANPTLAVTLDEPAAAASGQLPVVASGSSVTISATVSNTSGRVIVAATAILAFRPASGNVDPGAAAPVRAIGNLQPGERRQLRWRFEASGAEGQESAFTVVASAANAIPASTAGAFRYTRALSLAQAGPLLRDARRPAIVGDSFSAGEGAGDYRADGATVACHRSPHTYAAELFTAPPAILACAGATVPQVTTAGAYGEPAQAAALTNMTDPPDLILATLGADDVGLVDAIAYCYRIPSCQDSTAYPNPTLTGDCLARYRDQGAFERTVMFAGRPATAAMSAIARLDGCDDFVTTFAALAFARVAGLGRTLPVAYRTLDTALNHRGSSHPILVLSYPRLLPPRAESRGFCSGFDGGEVDFVAAFTDRLNGAVAAAVEQVRTEGVPVHLVADTADALIANHTVCDRQPHVVVTSTGAGAGRTEQESFFPDRSGYRDLTGALVRWSTRTGLTAPATVPERNLAWGDAGQSTDGIALRPVPASGEPTAVAGHRVLVTGDGYAPGTRVNLWIQSAPAAVGTAVAAADGSVRTEIVVPPDLAPGTHTVIAFGRDPAGQARWTFAVVDVDRPLSWWAIGLGALGVVLLLVGVIVWWRRRRTPGTTSSDVPLVVGQPVEHGGEVGERFVA